MQYIFGITEKGEPKTLLSYSGFRLWKENKEKYRDRYYRGLPSPDSAEMIFGKQIAKILEDEKATTVHPILRLVPRYKQPEYRLEVDLDGVRVQGYIDSFDPKNNAFYEYKTGHKSWDGKDPWDRVKVAKHEQLPFYSLLIAEHLGKVTRKCHLVFLETEMVVKEQTFQGQSFGLTMKEPRLTGRIEVFPRIVYGYERARIRQSILDIAKEITEDYQQYKSV